MESKKRIVASAVVIACSIAALVSLVAAGFAISSRFHETDSRRAANVEFVKGQKDTWHAVLCAIEAQVVAKQRSLPDTETALKFYDDLLTQQVRTKACGYLDNKGHLKVAFQRKA